LSKFVTLVSTTIIAVLLMALLIPSVAYTATNAPGTPEDTLSKSASEERRADKQTNLKVASATVPGDSDEAETSAHRKTEIHLGIDLESYLAIILLLFTALKTAQALSSPQSLRSKRYW